LLQFKKVETHMMSHSMNYTGETASSNHRPKKEISS